MVISSSEVAMSSGRAYKRQTRDRSSVRTWGEVLGAATSPRAQDSRTITQTETNAAAVELYQNYSSGGRLVAANAEKAFAGETKKTETREISFTEKSDSEEIGVTVYREVTGTMFRRLFTGSTENTNESEQTSGRPMTLIEFFSLLIRQRQEDFRRFLENYRIGMQNSSSGGIPQLSGQSGMTMQTEIITVSIAGDNEAEQTYSFVGNGGKLKINITRQETSSSETEDEKTAFATTGRVQTADGREIDFDVSLNMSRHFEQASETVTKNASVKLTDPLVINFGTGSAELTDSHFEFDIDCDGELDNIALLGQACGYLAIDLNEDGRIGDGSELFGTKSGDGFADLAVYDVDGNGWIDENDPVFDKLRIWSRDPDGTEHLAGLGIRGIGAIYLGSSPTQFSLKNEANETQGIIRSTGIFLREDGSSGTVQQIDLAKHPIAG
ncbi:MAG: hypothetical protein J5819_02255 [Eubacterium sp.]|nr:hypothetical protein [Eubacterium sp.]